VKISVSRVKVYPFPIEENYVRQTQATFEERGFSRTVEDERIDEGDEAVPHVRYDHPPENAHLRCREADPSARVHL
jgi:hypothetical protein